MSGRRLVRRTGDWLLLLAALLLFVCALHVLVYARTSWLLVVAILTAEWCHIPALIGFVLVAISWRRGRIGRVTAMIALVATCLCFWPIVSALSMQRSLVRQCAEAFGKTPDAPGRAQPFSFRDLLLGVPRDEVTVAEYGYATADGKPLKLDLYRSSKQHAAPPIILMIYGGSWTRGSKEQLPAINRYLASEGYAVAALNYRHAPKFQFPAQIEDVFRALEFLKARSAEFNIDPSNVVLIGRSAGGEIALSTAYSGHDPTIRGVVAFYPPTDLVLGYNKPSVRAVLNSQKVLRDYLGGAPAEKPEEYIAASPINFVNPNTPPTLLIHGRLDSVVWPEHSELLDRRLREAGRPHYYLSLGWATHGCDANLSGPSGQLSLYAIDQFLARFAPLPNE